MLKKLGTAAEEEKNHKKLLSDLKVRIIENETKLRNQETTYNGLKK
jgi:hypothetical protein